MENRQARTVMAFQKVLLFLQRDPISPEPPLLGRMRQSLHRSVERINRLAGEQTAAKVHRGAQVEHHRLKLRRERMMPLVRIARPLLAFAPGTAQALRVPHARASAVEVAESALAMVKALRRHQKLLVSAGYEKSFFSDFEREARALAESAQRAEAGRRRQARATQAIARELKKGMQAVTVIEGLVMLHQPARIAELRQSRRVPARIGRPRRRSARPAATS